MKTLFKWMSVAFSLYASTPVMAQTWPGQPTNQNPGTVDRANQERAERERREHNGRAHDASPVAGDYHR